MAGELVRLTQIDYRVEPGQPNLLGWDVADADGQVIGSLDDMLVETESGEILFGAVCYSNNRCTIVPLELMFLDEASKQLVLPVTKGDLDEAPDFSDKTEDIQPHVNYWNQMVSGWQEEMEEEEIFAEEIDESEEERLK